MASTSLGADELMHTTLQTALRSAVLHTVTDRADSPSSDEGRTPAPLPRLQSSVSRISSGPNAAAAAVINSLDMKSIEQVFVLFDFAFDESRIYDSFSP
jgi:hypothetical protein